MADMSRKAFSYLWDGFKQHIGRLLLPTQWLGGTAYQLSSELNGWRAGAKRFFAWSAFGLLVGAIVAVAVFSGGLVPGVFAGLNLAAYAGLWGGVAALAVPGFLGLIDCWRDQPAIDAENDSVKPYSRTWYAFRLMRSSLLLAPIMALMAPVIGTAIASFNALTWFSGLTGVTGLGAQIASFGAAIAAVMLGGQSLSALLMARAANQKAKGKIVWAAHYRYLSKSLSISLIGVMLAFVSGIGAAFISALNTPDVMLHTGEMVTASPVIDGYAGIFLSAIIWCAGLMLFLQYQMATIRKALKTSLASIKNEKLKQCLLNKKNDFRDQFEQSALFTRLLDTPLKNNSKDEVIDTINMYAQEEYITHLCHFEPEILLHRALKYAAGTGKEEAKVTQKIVDGCKEYIKDVLANKRKDDKAPEDAIIRPVLDMLFENLSENGKVTDSTTYSKEMTPFVLACMHPALDNPKENGPRDAESAKDVLLHMMDEQSDRYYLNNPENEEPPTENDRWYASAIQDLEEFYKFRNGFWREINKASKALISNDTPQAVSRALGGDKAQKGTLIDDQNQTLPQDMEAETKQETIDNSDQNNTNPDSPTSLQSQEDGLHSPSNG